MAEERDFDEQVAAIARELVNESDIQLIGQAQGFLMERFRVTAERAFTVLARASQDTNVELRDVAQRLIDTGESPAR